MLWKIRHEQYPQLPVHCKPQNELGRFPLILLVCPVLGKITSIIGHLNVDPEDTYSYISCTHLAKFVGTILGMFSCRLLERATMHADQRPMKLQRNFHRTRIGSPIQRRPQEASKGKLRENSQIDEAIS